MLRNSWNVGKLTRTRMQCVPGLPPPPARKAWERGYFSPYTLILCVYNYGLGSFHRGLDNRGIGGIVAILFGGIEGQILAKKKTQHGTRQVECHGCFSGHLGRVDTKFHFYSRFRRVWMKVANITHHRCTSPSQGSKFIFRTVGSQDSNDYANTVFPQS